MQIDSLQSSKPEIEKFLLRIDKKLRQLKADGISYSDRRLLKTRLQVLWVEDDESIAKRTA
jgi:hypothetical protein